MSYLTQQMTLNSEATVFEEMSKPLNIKIENLIKDETDWLARNGQDYESDEYQSHIEKYETLTNRYEQLDGYQYESKIKTVLHGLNFTENDFNKPINDFSGGQNTSFSCSNVT